MKHWLVRLCGPLVHLLFPFEVVGREHIPSDPRGLILCSNHISLIDPAWLLVSLPYHVRFMGKAELFRNPLAAWFFRKLGVFPVDRGAGDGTAIATAEQIVRDGKLMGIFPEGTRSKTGELLRVRSGASLIAAQTGADMLPVCLVTKGQKVRLFRRAKVVFSPVMTREELGLTGEKPDLRGSSRRLQARFVSLLEANR